MTTIYVSWDKELQLTDEATLNEDANQYVISENENDMIANVDESYVDNEGNLYVSFSVVRKGKDILYTAHITRAP